ncbi:MAG: ankyrin repeat domain-containing protein [Candidatus Micrarchaeia archaeon]
MKEELFEAVIDGNVGRVVELVRKGADPNARDEYGNTVLYWAAIKGNVEIVRMLIEAGVDVNARGECERTALHLAAKNGHAEVVRMLVEAGANPMVRDGDGKLPADYARDRRSIALLKHAKAAQVEDKNYEGPSLSNARRLLSKTGVVSRGRGQNSRAQRNGGPQRIA